MKRILGVFLFILSLFISSKTSVASEIYSYIPENPQKALILIHGYGQDGRNLQWMTSVLKDKLPDTAFYYPTAPKMSPVGGYQWFIVPAFGVEMADINLYDKMLVDAVKNVKVLHRLVEDIHNDLNIPYDYIDVAGFSQGGLMAVLTGLTYTNQIGRVVSFSGVPLVMSKSFEKVIIKSTPDIMLIQGANDQIVPPESIKMSEETFKKLGIEINQVVIEYMRHEITPEALQHAVYFLQ